MTFPYCCLLLPSEGIRIPLCGNAIPLNRNGIPDNGTVLRGKFPDIEIDCEKENITTSIA
ncbi:hypothetical protein HPQ64_00850 [Rhizobiales bacterium]|uniref:hypothetical protein n=1 Tax=Hongsoonwoonella zoysiae TaxID=2821844 RepID=UPI001560A7D0|nr:hypothetical protein [Hongsoonwoonella zoysiae]NRG16231.1 hypothetical protein [Hongsoonwoonella zoysiae]